VAPGPQAIGNLVASRRGARDGGDPHQVGLEVEIQRLDPLVLNGDFRVQLLGHEGSQRSQREGRVAQRRLEDSRLAAMDVAGG
jgi:hypothetical protein